MLQLLRPAEPSPRQPLYLRIFPIMLHPFKVPFSDLCRSRNPVPSLPSKLKPPHQTTANVILRTLYNPLASLLLRGPVYQTAVKKIHSADSLQGIVCLFHNWDYPGRYAKFAESVRRISGRCRGMMSRVVAGSWISSFILWPDIRADNRPRMNI